MTGARGWTGKGVKRGFRIGGRLEKQLKGLRRRLGQSLTERQHRSEQRLTLGSEMLIKKLIKLKRNSTT